VLIAESIGNESEVVPSLSRTAPDFGYVGPAESGGGFERN
jgi:hypothetical protein